MNLAPEWMTHDPNATPTAQEVEQGRRVHITGLSGGGGQTGPAGKSAYQVWLDQGNSGTETDYLLSLKGSPGTNGRDGVDGQPGSPGTNGQPGTNGRDGVDGAPGTNGQDGDRGPAGPPGQSITIAGYFETLADLEAIEPTLGPSDAGKTYITMEFGHLHFWTGTSFTDGGNIVGPEGKPGKDGSNGRDGNPGRDGTNGTNGRDGADGQPGAPGKEGPQGPPGTAANILPAGGRTGQILSKASVNDYDIEWVNNEHNHPIVAEGSLVPRGTKLDLVLNNIKITLVSTTDLVHGLEISTVTGEEVVDFRFGGHYDGAGTENYTMDGEKITTTPVMRDSVILNASRNPNEFWLRENGRLWRGHTFVSGRNAERSSIWAQRIV